MGKSEIGNRDEAESGESVIDERKGGADEKFVEARAPQPAREARALPGRETECDGEAPPLQKRETADGKLAASPTAYRRRKIRSDDGGGRSCRREDSLQAAWLCRVPELPPGGRTG